MADDTRPKTAIVSENSRLRRALAKTDEVAEKSLGTILTGAGGAAAGVLDSKYPSIRGTVVSGGMAAGIVLTVAGLAGWLGKGKTAAQVAELGSGMLAGTAGIRTYKAFEARKTAK